MPDIPQKSVADAPPSGPIVFQDPAGSLDNMVRPFAIEGMDVKGRAVRLGTAVDQVLSAHGYTDAVAQILGEFLVLAGLIGSALKAPGVVTVQAKARGPITMIVADCELDAAGQYNVRGYADVDAEKLAHYGKNPSSHGLIGSKTGGYLAITIDPGQERERYQGIVTLAGESLADVARDYFLSSEQLPTALRIAVRRDAVTGHWRAGGIMVQHLARGEEGRERILSPAGEEEWGRASILMESVREDELLDPQLGLDTLLFRLFNEDGVRVFAGVRLARGCRCSEERLRSVMQQFSADDIAEMTVDGRIIVNCQFCNRSYDFDPAEFGSE